MESEHKDHLYLTEILWISKGRVVSRIFELRYELKIFLRDVQSELAVHLTNPNFDIALKRAIWLMAQTVFFKVILNSVPPTRFLTQISSLVRRTW